MTTEAELEGGEVASERGRGRRTALRVFALVGLGLCLVLAIGIILGRVWLGDQVAGVFASVDQAVARGNTVVAVTTGRIQERVTDLDELIAEARASAGSASLPPALAARTARMAERFEGIRDGWVDVRSRIDAALETLAQIDRALPFVDLPSGPVDELAALDARIEEIQSNVARLRSGAASRIEEAVTAATGLRGAVDRVAEVGVGIQARLAQVEDRLDRAQATISNVMWATTLLLLLLVGYVALLNVLLLRATRR